MLGSILLGKDGILSPRGKLGFFAWRQEGSLLTGKVEKWSFTGERRSVVDFKQAWKEAGASQSGFLQCLTVSLHFIEQ